MRAATSQSRVGPAEEDVRDGPAFAREEEEGEGEGAGDHLRSDFKPAKVMFKRVEPKKASLAHFDGHRLFNVGGYQLLTWQLPITLDFVNDRVRLEWHNPVVFVFLFAMVVTYMLAGLVRLPTAGSDVDTLTLAFAPAYTLIVGAALKEKVAVRVSGHGRLGVDSLSPSLSPSL